MRTKSCVSCGEQKPLYQYYAHPFGKAGLMSKCKECHKASVRANYASNRASYHAYEQVRSKRPDRKKWVSDQQRIMRARSPEKYKARTAVGNAVRDGRLVRQPCRICGSLRVQAHHDDYSKPLDVQWLCFKCHREHEHGQTVTA